MSCMIVGHYKYPTPNPSFSKLTYPSPSKSLHSIPATPPSSPNKKTNQLGNTKTKKETKMRTISTTSTLAPMATITSFPTTRSATHSPWHSPIPYLFGGLAAMLGLIAFALLMLACSYWRLSNQSQSQGGDNIRDLEKEGDDPQKKEPSKVYEEKVLVIMAGEEKPTFLATPVFPIYGIHHGKDCDTHLGNRESTLDVSEKETMDKDNNHVVHANVTTTTQENEGSQEQQQNQ